MTTIEMNAQGILPVVILMVVVSLFVALEVKNAKARRVPVRIRRRD